MLRYVRIPVGNKALVALVNNWSDNEPEEISICIENENHLITQDICTVREHFFYDGAKWKRDSSLIDCKVWGNSDNEDFTDEFCIGVYEEEQE